MTNKVWVLVGGLPGSGKTHLGAQIARSIGLFLDKDTLSRFFAEDLLTLLGRSPHDRESQIYTDRVRPKEYETLQKVAQENLELGHSTVCAAPFLREFDDPHWREGIEVQADLAGASLHYIWIDSDEDSIHERLRKRGAARDAWKLANWTTWWLQAAKGPPSLDGLLTVDNRVQAAGSTQKQLSSIMEKLSRV
jgi:predicted kinase